jgi:hypothetical protein
MMARQQLIAAYDFWEQCTQRESVAIREGNWDRVNECQKTKLELFGRIVHLTEAANVKCAEADLDSKDFQQNVRRTIHGLIAQEIQNGRVLTDRRNVATSQIAELDHACRNLKRVQKFYGQPSRAAWHSYS